MSFNLKDMSNSWFSFTSKSRGYHVRYMQVYSEISCAFIPRLRSNFFFKRLFSIFGNLTMSLLEKLSDEFGLCDVDYSAVSLIQEETCMLNNSFENSPANKQPSFRRFFFFSCTKAAKLLRRIVICLFTIFDGRTPRRKIAFRAIKAISRIAKVCNGGNKRY